MSLRNAWRGGEALTPGTGPVTSLRTTLTTCLVLTWANPHVYLDTLALMGAVSSGYEDRLSFALGGMTAPAVFFAGLGYGARLLAPIFRLPVAWRVLDVGVAVVMVAIGVGLVW